MDISFFAAMAWKSVAIAGAALGLAALLRSRSAADRAAVLRIGVLMLLALPVIALLLPELRIAAFAPAPAVAPTADSFPIIDAPLAMAAMVEVPASSAPGLDPGIALLVAYLAGLMVAAARFAGGLWTLRAWTKAARPVEDESWTAAFEKMRWAAPSGERLRLMVSGDVPAPLSWGWRRPVILIDPETLSRGEAAEAILAHEVAHVARRDWPALMLSRAASVLFWFNPLVWLLDRQVVQQAEEAADRHAAESVEPLLYAQSLLRWASANAHALPANGIAGRPSALARRVRAVLDTRLRERPSESLWTAAAILACIGIAAPVAAVELVEARAEAQRAPTETHSAAMAPAHEGAARAQAHAREAVVEARIAEHRATEAMREAEERMAEIMPRVPEMVESAMAGIDPEAIGRAAEVAARSVRAEAPQIRAEVAAAMREAQAELRANRVQIAEAVQEGLRASAAARASAVAGIAHGATGMEAGAAGMEAGARKMEEQAQRFRQRDYREWAIARAAERGETVTHEELIEAARGLEEGARGMRDGARSMRESAQAMRSGRH